jgi:hypothetical protein
MEDAPKFRPTPKGQKSGSETRQRTSRFTVRCTPEQRQQIETAADRAGLSLAAYVLGATLKAKPPRAAHVPPVDRVALAQVLGQLGRLNSNVNQIARAINYRQNPELYDLRDVPKVVEALAREIMAALGKGTPAPKPDDDA